MENKNSILIGFTIPNDDANIIFRIDKSPAIQTHKFAWSLTRSIKAAGLNVSLISTTPIQNFPAGKKIFFFSQKFVENQIHGQQIFFINVLILKHITRLISIFSIGIKLLIRSDIDYIFIHGVHSPFIIFGFICRLFGKKVIVVLTDPPGVILDSDGIISSLLKKIDSSLLKIILKRMTGVIALSKYLAVNYAPKTPSLVFPGIANKDLLIKLKTLHSINKKNTVFTVAYAGGLNEIYGINSLINAVQNYTSTPIILKLYGRGDQEDLIISISRTNANVVYKGFLEQEKLIPELLNADLLINPRPSKGNVSIESFPSKLIEYLALGKPVLTTKLQSIPNEYQHLFYYINDESPMGIAKAIDFVANLSKDEIINFGLKSKKFITSNATEEVIGKKIKKFLTSLHGH